MTRSHLRFSGFTLIEALLATVLLAILFQLAIANIYQGQQTQQLRQSAQELVQNIRTAQNYAQGGRKFGICEGTYNVAPPVSPDTCESVYGALCGGSQYPECVPPMDNTEVPRGGYGIMLAQSDMYSLYADTHVIEDDDPSDGDYRWLVYPSESVDPLDPDELEPAPFQEVRMTSATVKVIGFQVNNDPTLYLPSPTKRLYMTFEPPFGNGHIIFYDGTIYSQDTSLQSARIWLKGDATPRCRALDINGITGQITEQLTDCP